jgi:hypothetical protein
MQAFAREILQRRCATLGEEAAVWEEDVHRLELRGRYSHAEQLLLLISGHLGSIVGMTDEAGLASVALHNHIELVEKRRRDAITMRDTRNEDDAGQVAVAHRERRPLTNIGSCFGRHMDRSNLHLHAIICMRAVAAAMVVSQTTISQGTRLNANSAAQVAARRVTAACGHIIHALIHDGLPSQVMSYLSGDRHRICRLLVVAFFQQFLRCNQEAREATFTHVDALIAALVAPRNAEDHELKACLCTLIHDLVFGGGCEQRMVMRLQREASPRSATSLEEWFLDTLLVQNDAQEYKDQIQQSTQADAWLICSSPGGSGADLGAFFSGAGGGLE